MYHCLCKSLWMVLSAKFESISLDIRIIKIGDVPWLLQSMYDLPSRVFCSSIIGLVHPLFTPW